APVAHAAAYGVMRRGRRGMRGTLVQVEPRLSLTGANADVWLPARPGTEGVVALGLAHTIIYAGLREATAAGRDRSLIEGRRDERPTRPAEGVENATGGRAARIERLAGNLAERGPAVVIVGGAPLAHTNGLFTALAVNALNALIGAVDAEGGVTFTRHAL